MGHPNQPHRVLVLTRRIYNFVEFTYYLFQCFSTTYGKLASEDTNLKKTPIFAYLPYENKQQISPSSDTLFKKGQPPRKIRVAGAQLRL